VSWTMADLHIHTRISPCADEEMTPQAIVEASLRMRLGIIGICDHNTGGNTDAVREAAGNRLQVISGMEITTAEEVHVLAFFGDRESLSAMDQMISETLPLQRGRRMLQGATSFSMDEVLELVREHNGLSVAAHVDRPAFSVVSQLGLFPPNAAFDAVEVSAVSKDRWKDFAFGGLPVVVGSDSHFLTEVGTVYTIFEIREPSFDEMRLALKRTDGRRCWIA
jgi:predicted metal-dependent phosphoesterase TrpH